MVKISAEKSGFPTSAAINGVSKSFTSAVTMAPKAPPMTTATARSTTLPRNRNSLKPFSIDSLHRLMRHGVNYVVDADANPECGVLFWVVGGIGPLPGIAHIGIESHGHHEAAFIVIDSPPMV